MVTDFLLKSIYYTVLICQTCSFYEMIGQGWLLTWLLIADRICRGTLHRSILAQIRAYSQPLVTSARSLNACFEYKSCRSLRHEYLKQSLTVEVCIKYVHVHLPCLKSLPTRRVVFRNVQSNVSLYLHGIVFEF